VQNRIARAIVGNLRNRNGGGGSPVPAAKSVDPEAYRLYLRGRHFADRWTRENFEQALSSYRAAIERDPAYAPAYAGLAELYSIVDHRPALMDFDPDETYRLGIQFAEKALIVDPESSEAHSALGHIYVHTGQWAEAERHLAEAIRINPNSAGANLWYALLVQILGRSAEGKAQRLKAVQLDPLSIQVNTVVMAAAWRDGDFDQAIEFGRAAVTVAPEESEVWGSLAIALAFAGRFREADEAVSRAASSPRPSRMVDEQRARLLALEGRKREAQVLLEEIESDPERNPGPIALMRGWAATGDLERALPLLEQAVEKSPQYARVNIGLPPHPVYRELRNHPRYREALRKLGLPN
jgi:tetratricopeptide (TPR) repeat protein